MATVDKNFRIKNGLVVEGSTATVGGNNVLIENTQASDSYILNLIGGETLVKSVDINVFNVDGTGYLSINANTFDSYGSASAAQLAAEGFAQNAADGAEQNAKSYADDLAVNYDAAGAAATAESNAEFYTDNAIGNLGGSGTASVAGNIDILTGTGIQVNSGNNSVEIDRQTVNTWYDASGSADAAQQAAALYTDNAVSALVDSAPAMLDTLNELAAAIADNPNYATDVTNLVATKADTTYVDNQISSLDTAAQGYADVAESDAKAYADGLAVNYDAAGAAASAETAAASYTDGQISNLTTGGNGFQKLNIDDVIAQQATFSESLSAILNVVFEWDSADYRSAKVIVKAANGAHTQISELMITLDTSNNVAVSEYGITYSNGTELAAITADYLNGNVRVLATPANASTDVTVFATLLI